MILHLKFWISRLFQREEGGGGRVRFVFLASPPLGDSFPKRRDPPLASFWRPREKRKGQIPKLCSTRRQNIPTKPGRFLTTLFVSHKRDKIIKECHQQQSDLLPCKGIRYTAASTTFPFPANNLFIPIKHLKNRACIKREEKPLKEFSFLFSSLLWISGVVDLEDLTDCSRTLVGLTLLNRGRSVKGEGGGRRRQIRFSRPSRLTAC